MHARENIYIDGKWVAASGEGSIEIVNPATEQCIGSVPVGSAADVEKAVVSHVCISILVAIEYRGAARLPECDFSRNR